MTHGLAWSSPSNMMGSEATLLKSTDEKKGRCKRESSPQKSENLKGEVKSRRGLRSASGWKSAWRPCDKGSEKAKEGGSGSSAATLQHGTE